MSNIIPIDEAEFIVRVIVGGNFSSTEAQQHEGSRIRSRWDRLQSEGMDIRDAFVRAAAEWLQEKLAGD